MFRDTDNDGQIGTGDAGPSGFYYLTDAMFSVRAITDSAGLLHTRLDYTPYGVAMHGLAADANGDGSVNTADLGVVSANYNGGNELQPVDTGYDPDAFLDGSDTIVLSDYTGRYSPYVSGGSGPTFNAGWIDNPGDTNGPDNSVGYDGYWFDLAGATEATSSGLYMVRHRVYDPKLGRWLQRDPAGYRAGSSLFENCGSRPVYQTDPSGLYPIPVIPPRMIPGLPPPIVPPKEGPGVVHAPGFDPSRWWYPGDSNGITVIYNDPYGPPPLPPPVWPNCCGNSHPKNWQCTAKYGWWKGVACSAPAIARTPGCTALCKNNNDPNIDADACADLCLCLNALKSVEGIGTIWDLVRRQPIITKIGGVSQNNFSVTLCQNVCYMKRIGKP